MTLDRSSCSGSRRRVCCVCIACVLRVMHTEINWASEACGHLAGELMRALSHSCPARCLHARPSAAPPRCRCSSQYKLSGGRQRVVVVDSRRICSARARRVRQRGRERRTERERDATLRALLRRIGCRDVVFCRARSSARGPTPNGAGERRH